MRLLALAFCSIIAVQSGCGGNERNTPSRSPDTLAPDREGTPRDTHEGVVFRGLGQEPGWMLEIIPGRHIQFEYNYAQDEVFTPVPESVDSAGLTVYHAVTEAHDLRVAIQDSTCHDVMSGHEFEATVTVELNGKAYRGCGRMLGDPTN